MCKCPRFVNDTLNPSVGLVEERALSATAANAGEETEAVVGCTQRHWTRLTRICNVQGGDSFRNHAQQTFQSCVRESSKLNSTDGALSFRSEECLTKLFHGTLQSGDYAVWQDDFFVGSSSLRYLLGVGSVDSEAEWKQMKSCSAEFTNSLQNVCINSNKDFSLSSSHAFQCRRIRVKSDNKFGCDDDIPTDISAEGLDSSVRNTLENGEVL